LHRAEGPVQVNVEGFYSLLTALRAIGTLSHNHSLNRRQEQSPIRQEATKVSGQEMKTNKSSNSATSGIATGQGACTKRVRKRVKSLGPTEQKDRSPTVFIPTPTVKLTPTPTVNSN